MEQPSIYLIKHIASGLVKVGITNYWQQRCKQLSVGQKCTAIKVVFCDQAEFHEKLIHSNLDDFRLPQSEWFKLNKKQLDRLTTEIGLLGKENLWRPGSFKQKPKKQSKKHIRFSEAELELCRYWCEKMESEPFISRISFFADAIVAWGLEVRNINLWGPDRKLELTPVASIYPTDNGICFKYIKWRSWKRIKNDIDVYVDCFSDLMKLLASHHHSIEKDDDIMLLPENTKIKSNIIDYKNYSAKMESRELEQYF